jgi:hypothetical protein
VQAMRVSWETILIEFDAKIALFSSEQSESTVPLTLDSELLSFLARGYPRFQHFEKVCFVLLITATCSPELQGFLTREFTARKLKSMSQSIVKSFAAIQTVRAC